MVELDGEHSKRVGDRLADDLARLDPLLASEWGLRSSRLPGLDPEWWQERRRLFAAAQAALSQSADDQTAAVLRERTATETDWFDSGEAYCEVQAAMDSPLFRIRYCFDDMQRATLSDWEDIAARLEDVPSSVGGYQRSLEEGRRSGSVGVRRQVLATAATIDEWTEVDSEAAAFAGVRSSSDDGMSASLRARLEVASTAARDAYVEVGRYLRHEYAECARADDAVGSERFALWSRRYSGTVIGHDDYAWCAEQLAVTNRDQQRLRTEVQRATPSRVVEGEDAHVAWATEQIERAADTLAAAALIDERAWPPIEVRPLAASGGQQAYYSAALADGSKPATVWISGGDGPHHVEYEKTLLFHESIPGHHVETVVQREATHLSRFQQLVYLPGHSEGWGLYAERLAEEAGLIDSPHARLGCRGSQALRLASLLVDVGLHTNVAPPTELRSICGDSWTVDGAVALVIAQGVDADVADWWVTNMIGRPGHRASYAAGERAWLQRRTASTANMTAAAFHAQALSQGPMGLDVFRQSR